MTTKTTPIRCFFGIHKWGEETLVGDHPRFPNIVRASLEYMNMGYEHACSNCGKIEKAHR